MLLPRRLLAVAGAVATLAATASAATPAINGWFDCSAVTFAEQLPETAAPSSSTEGSAATGNGFPTAECATFKAPLCYEGVCDDGNGTEIDIFVKRIAAVEDGKPNIFFMQGGPGAASPAMESAMTGVYAILNGSVNVYTMDHRGTGRSTKLDCVAAQAQTSGSPSGTWIDATEVGNCAVDIENKYGSDRASFSVTSAASDLKLFISSFLAGQQTFVYGVSYGSSLVERLMHLDTEGVAGYILDGISTTSGSDVKNFEYFSVWDLDYDEVAQYFLSFCAQQQQDCGQYFKDATLSQTLKTLVAKLDSDTSYKCYAPMDTLLAALYSYPVNTYAPGESLRSLLGSLFADATLRTLIPVIAYRATRCSSDDLKVLTQLFAKYEAYSSGGPSEDDGFSSDLLYQMIVYSEFWEEPTPSTEDMYARFLNTSVSSGMYSAVQTYCVFSKENSSACSEFSDAATYNATPLVYKRDQYWNVAAKPPKDVSVLVMSSKMDPQTPHKYAEFLFEALDTDNKQLVTFEQATHGTLWSTPLSNDDADAPICGMNIVASYVAVGGDLAKMDTACVAKMPALSLQVPEKLVKSWLKTDSAVDGKFVGENTQSETESEGGSTTSGSHETSYKSGFIVVLVLFVVVLVAAAMFLVKWRRAAKKTQPKDRDTYQLETV